MRGAETDYVISGPMKGLKKAFGMDIRQTDHRQTDHRQTDRHINSMTDPAQKADSVKIYIFFSTVLGFDCHG